LPSALHILEISQHCAQVRVLGGLWLICFWSRTALCAPLLQRMQSTPQQSRFVLFRCSLRQTAAFCRVLPEAVSVTVHDTFHLFGCSNVPSCKPGTLRTVPVEMNFADGTKAAIRRSSRALIWGGVMGERRNGEARGLSAVRRRVPSTCARVSGSSRSSHPLRHGRALAPAG
jgi:hypothetical protein